MDQKDNTRSGGFRVPVQGVGGEYAIKGTVDKCEIMDLSFAGIGIKITHIIAEGDLVDLRFTLPELGRVYCKGKVVVVRGGRIGLSFVEIPEKSKKIVNKYIENYTNNNIKKMLSR